MSGTDCYHLVDVVEPPDDTSGTVTDVTATLPITSSGGATPDIAINLSTQFTVVGGNLTIVMGSASAVRNAVTLNLLDDTILENGSGVFVASFRDIFELDKINTAGAVADGITFIATASGLGIWVRKFLGGASWASQADWYIDPATGNDENNGTVVSPLASVQEFVRRMKNGFPLVFMTLHVITEDIRDIDFEIDFGSGGDYREIEIVCEETVLHSGSFTSVTAFNASTSTSDIVIDTALPVSWSDSGLLGKNGRVSSGVATGYNFVVDKQNPAGGGVKQARLTRFIDVDSFTTAQPLVGATYDVYECGRLGGSVYFTIKGNGSVVVRSASLGVISTGFGVVIYSGFVLFKGGQVFNLVIHPAGGADFDSTHHDDILHVLSPGGLVLDGALLTRTGGAAITVDHGGLVAVATSSLVSGGSGITVHPGGYIECISNLAVYDSTADGLIVESTGAVAISAGIYLFGSGNAAYGIRTYSGGQVTYDGTKPTLTGATNDTIVGGAATAYAAIPLVNAANLAMIVLKE